MSTINEKLATIKTCKANIYTAIQNKGGGATSGGTKLSKFPNDINVIESSDIQDVRGTRYCLLVYCDDEKDADNNYVVIVNVPLLSKDFSNGIFDVVTVNYTFDPNIKNVPFFIFPLSMWDNTYMDDETAIYAFCPLFGQGIATSAEIDIENMKITFKFPSL